jgi:hypothetical protein
VESSAAGLADTSSCCMRLLDCNSIESCACSCKPARGVSARRGRAATFCRCHRGGAAVEATRPLQLPPSWEPATFRSTETAGQTLRRPD